MKDLSIISDIMNLLFEMPLLGLLAVAVIAFVLFKSDGWEGVGKFMVLIIALAVVGFVGAIVSGALSGLWETLSDITGLKEKTIVLLAKLLGALAFWAIVLGVVFLKISKEKKKEESKKNDTNSTLH